jgi:hypothetical protein
MSAKQETKMESDYHAARAKCNTLCREREDLTNRFTRAEATMSAAIEGGDQKFIDASRVDLYERVVEGEELIKDLQPRLKIIGEQAVNGGIYDMWWKDRWDHVRRHVNALDKREQELKMELFRLERERKVELAKVQPELNALEKEKGTFSKWHIEHETATKALATRLGQFRNGKGSAQ